MNTPKSQKLDEQSAAWEIKLNVMAESLQNRIDSLQDIINRDSIVDIAARVEVHQHILQTSMDKIDQSLIILKEIRQQFRSSEGWVTDNALDPMLEAQASLLLESFMKMENESEDLVYFADKFIKQFIKK